MGSSKSPNNAPSVATIRTLLNIADDGSIAGGIVSIGATTLQSIDGAGVIPQLITLAYSTNTIVINEAKANPVSEGTNVIINGTGTFNFTPDSVAVTMTLSIVNNNVQALLQYEMIPATPPTTPWKFSDSFPKLPTLMNGTLPDAAVISPLDQLQMSDAQFLLSTYEQTVNDIALSVGVNFSAALTPTGVLGIFENLIGTGQMIISGTVNSPDASQKSTPLGQNEFPWNQTGIVPGINLMADLNVAAFQLGSMTFSADYFRVYSPASTDWQANNSTYNVTVGYTGAFDIPSAQANIGVAVVTPPGTDAAQLVADFTNSPIGDFSKLVDILGINNALSLFPSEVQSGNLGGLGIQNASVSLAYNKSIVVSAVSVSVGMPQIDWKVWPGVFEVISVMAEFDVQNPFDDTNRAIDINVTGTVEVAGTTVTISAVKSNNFTVTASVPDGFNVPLSTLMESYAPGIPPVSDLAIDTLQLAVSPGNFYSFTLAMAQQPQPWVIPLGVTQLEFSDVNLFLLKQSAGDLSGNFSATAQIAGVTLNASYDIPGTVVIRGDFPSVTLSEIVSFLLQQQLQLPDGFDLTFTDSYIILQKSGSDYQLQLGTVIDNIASLAFVLEKGTTGWGVAVGLQIELSQLGNLPGGISGSVQTFADWFPFQTFTLAISTIQDQNFSFPGFQTFNQPSLGTSKITLPAIAQGIQPGFFLYTSTVFTRKNNILGALIDLIKIPEGTQLDGFIAYLTEKKQFQLGISISTFLTPDSDVSKRTCTGDAGYLNGCLTGTLMFVGGGGGDFGVSLMATVKTIIDSNNVEFDLIIAVVENGVFISGSMHVQQPISFGPLQLGGLAIELGISFEGLPSFGFSAELEVDDLFDSSLSVLINSENPSECMIAGALSNLTLDDVVSKLAGTTGDSGLDDILKQISISGTSNGAFQVPAGSEANTLIDSLNNFNGQNISNDFVTYGKLPSFPTSSDGMMIFNNADSGKWYITEQAGAGSNSTITHWQVIKDQNTGALNVSREAQFYFVPAPAGVNIGTFFYPQGMSISGNIKFLFIDIDVDIDIALNKGILVDAEMEPITFISTNLFSITAQNGSGGPQLSLCTYSQPNAPQGFQDPHFFISGKVTVLGAGNSVFVNINSSGAQFLLSGSTLGGFFSGTLTGTFNENDLQVGGQINIGIGSIDLGPLGTWNIDTGVNAGANIYAHLQGGTAGADFSAGFELGGNQYSIGTLSLNINTGKLSDLPAAVFNAVKDFLVNLFTDPKKWAEMAAKVLNWVEDQVTSVLESAFGLSESDAKAILSALGLFCPIITAVNILGS
ncbi:hypothetical protein F0919_14375 [Taibaiella lutea]|uniref:Uncharacterized protein n=1 Tax=Taibaiella lutea TaxID=2608001 RepID=A0A5M6CK49_9BACT|nr:hypothetical protein [Taibaiella lutea]KAA5533715.1 hypothetical protein F0919_14375 [Taibaiella lutea]